MARHIDPQPPVSNVERAKYFLLYGFAISIALHLILGPFLKFERTQTQEDVPQKVTVVRVPTPPPTPKPTPTPQPTVPPTPPPKTTPPPNTPAPEQPKIKINTIKTTSKTNSGPTEDVNKYQTGNTQGIPQGQGTSAPSTAPPAQGVMEDATESQWTMDIQAQSHSGTSSYVATGSSMSATSVSGSTPAFLAR